MNEIQNLNFRKSICLFCIQTLEGMTDEPDAPAALEEYRRQLAEIERKLAEAQKPPDIVIQLKTAVLFGKEGHNG